ncbi:oxidoreductase [Asticcacaulis sp.]|uniref:oxidoreductase n=1 Tax=Asticcacaulis sp. TaxID=1872648 RepID=UPI002C6D4457|nr:oxidoreductase [Asticcacaulis sp.]HTM83154.1 oxidoreductase [Asticcacaulis sp.]
MIKTALVGYGYAGKTIHAPLIRAAKGLELTTVVSSRPADVQADLPGVTVAPDLTTALADPAIELVVVATPNDIHASMAHEALEAGKSVVIDKPFALSVAEGESVLAHAERVGKMVSVFHCRRWDSNYLTLQALRPRLGDLYQVILRYDRLRPVVRNRWRERAGPGSGIWFDLGSHLVDQALSLFGWPEWISVDITGQRPGAQTDDYFHATLGYGPLRVILHSSMMTTIPGPALEVQGALGAFVKFGMDTQEEMLKAGRTPGDAGWGADPVTGLFRPVIDDLPGPPEDITATPGNYLAYYEAMAKAIRKNAPNPVTGEDALKVMKLLESGFVSSREGRRVST